MKVHTVFYVLALVVAGPAPLWGHGLGAQCSLRGSSVQVEAYFDDDTPAVQARISVRDVSEKIVMEGKTDSKGTWSFATPAAGKYMVIVDAGAGHRFQTTVVVPSIPGSRDPENLIRPSGVLISEGPDKATFTRFSYLKVALGIGSIFLFSLAFLVAHKVGRRRPGSDPMDAP